LVIHSSSRSVLSPPESDSALIYEPFYGLKEKPFSLSSDPRFLYKSHAHAGAFNDLLTAIRRREGLIVLTGDIGTGKTTLCRAVLQNLDRKTFTSLVPDPFVSREDLLKMLLIDFGVMSVDDLVSGRLKGVSRPDLSYPLYDFLKSLQPLNAFAVMIIDEAQNVPPPLLEEIRILSDLEDRQKLLQVVLVGQLELRAHLRLPEMRQVDQRISVRCELGPLTREGAGEYIKHRLRIAGLEPDQQPFLPAAIDEVFKASRGVPRIINLVCDRALQRGFDQQLSLIGPDLITRAVIELDLGSLVPGSPDAVTVDSEVNSSVAAAAPAGNRASTTAAQVLESPNELDLEALSDLDPPPPKWLAGDDEFEEAGDEAGRTGGREGVLGLGVSDQRYDADLEGDPDWYVVLRRAARAVALLMLAAVLAWGGWQLWLKMSVPSSAVPAPISATPSAPESQPTVAPVASGLLPGASSPSLLRDPLLRRDPTVSPDLSLVPDPLRRSDAAGLTPRSTVPEVSRSAPRVPSVEPSGQEYIVQVASLTSPESADALVRTLANSGFRAYRTEVELGTGERVLRVYVGRYRSRAQAELAATLIRQRPGFSDTLVLQTDAVSTEAAGSTPP
jgi:type II secretory pathway predicted ATPase ExeA/cell division septation protein DedD